MCFKTIYDTAIIELVLLIFNHVAYVIMKHRFQTQADRQTDSENEGKITIERVYLALALMF